MFIKGMKFQILSRLQGLEIQSITVTASKPLNSLPASLIKAILDAFECALRKQHLIEH